MVAELEKAKLAGKKHEVRVAKVQVELKDAIQNLEALEKKKKEQSFEFSKAEKEL